MEVNCDDSPDLRDPNNETNEVKRTHVFESCIMKLGKKNTFYPIKSCDKQIHL